MQDHPVKDKIPPENLFTVVNDCNEGKVGKINIVIKIAPIISKILNENVISILLVLNNFSSFSRYFVKYITNNITKLKKYVQYNNSK